MFSLIITIISIALVAALALATLYYGGDAFNQGRAQAQASRIINQQQQLQAADTLFRTTMGRAPTGLSELVSEKFLKTIPVAQATALSAAMAQSQEWAMPVPAQPVFVLDGVDSEVCAKFNEMTYGADGVLTLAHDTLTTQCYGETSTMKVVSARTSAAIVTVAAADTADFPAADLTSDAVPSTLDDAAWEVQPTHLATVASGGGSGGGAETGNGLMLTSGSGAFGIAGLGETVQTTFTITNDGPGDLALTAPSVSGDAAFTVQGTTCGGTLADGASCDVTVQYSSSVPGTSSGSVTLANALSEPLSAAATVTWAGLHWTTPIVSGDYSSVVAHCAGTHLGETGWRLPTVSESQALRANRNTAGAVSTTHTNWTNPFVRTGDAGASSSHMAYSFRFNTISDVADSLSAGYHATCVK